MTALAEGTIDIDALPPTQYLVMEVLAARRRTGEITWTFPSRITPALRALEAIGAVWWKAGVAQGTCVAGLTDRGQRSALSPTYVTPVGGALVKQALVVIL